MICLHSSLVFIIKETHNTRWLPGRSARRQPEAGSDPSHQRSAGVFHHPQGFHRQPGDRGLRSGLDTEHRKDITFTCPNGCNCRDSSLHNETFLKENLEAILHYRQTTGIRPATPEPDEGWMGELVAGWFRVAADLERDAGWQLPAPPTWTDRKQHCREALKKLAMGQKFSGNQHRDQTM